MWFSVGSAALNFALAFFFLGSMKASLARGILAGLTASAGIWSLCVFIERLVETIQGTTTSQEFRLKDSPTK